MRSWRSKTEVDPVPLNRQRVTNPYNLLLPVNNFGTTHVGIYMPGLRLPMRFRNLDMISASQYFPLLRNNALSPYVKERRMCRMADPSSRKPLLIQLRTDSGVVVCSMIMWLYLSQR